jgi:hypothetical protein
MIDYLNPEAPTGLYLDVSTVFTIS